MNLLDAALVGGPGSAAVQVAGSLLPMPGLDTRAAAAWLGRPVIFGIRPEDIYDRAAAHPAGAAAELAGEVAAIEPLGAETLLALSLPGIERDIMMRAGRDCRVRVGDRMPILLDLAAAHVFDPETTKAIAADRAPLTFLSR